MFDFIRNHTRLTLGFLLLLIIPSFVFFGVQGYSKFTDASATTAAKVDGHSITMAEWDALHKRNVDRIRRERPDIDTRMFETPEVRRDTLEGIVRERVLIAAANKLHLTPSDGRLQRLFVSDPQFASLRNPDGTVNRDILAAQGMNSEMFAAQLRQEFGMQQVLAGVTRTAVAPASVATQSLDALLQRREIQFQRFDAAAYRAKANPSEAEIEAFFKQQEAQFKAPEQATIEYLVLDMESLAKGLTVSEDELRKYYTDNAARFTAVEERRASHILIKADKDTPSAERQKAKARAEELMAEARKNPSGFAELARKNSQDAGSAAQGGDLDFFGRGAMVKPFEEAVFALKPGEISQVVESDFGYHVILLAEVRGGQKKPFDSVRAEIESSLRQSLAQKRWPELAEQFTNVVYEQSDSLKPAMDKLKLELKTATLQRKPAAGAQGPLASAKFLDAIFANEAVANKRNTDAVEFGVNRLVAGRVVQHNPARALPLAEVKDQVRERLVAKLGADLALKEGQARLAALQKNGSETLASTAIVSRAQMGGLPRNVLDLVLSADAGKLPTVIGVDLKEQGYIVVRVTQVLPREPAPGGDAGLQAQYAQSFAAAEADAYLNALKARYKAEIRPGVALPAEPASAPAR
jgi:peptidyl-prolyl cis-trans isomerase D